MRSLELPDRVPPLSGWFLQMYRLVWIVVGAGAVASMVMAYRMEVRAQAAVRAEHDVGLVTEGVAPEGVRVRPLGGMARRAGVRDGNVLLRVNGEPARVEAVPLGRMLDGPEGGTVAVTLKQLDGRVQDVTLVRSSAYLRDAYAGSGLTFARRRWIEFSMNMLQMVLIFLAAILLFLRRSRESVAAMLALALLLMLISEQGLGLPAWTQRVGLASWSVLFSLGILLFPDGRFVSRWTWAGVAVSAVQTVYFVAARYYSPILVVILGSYLATLAVAVTVRYRKTPPGTERQQIKYFVLGVAGWAGCFILSMFATPAMRWVTDEGSRAWLFLAQNAVEALGDILLGLGLLTSLLRYRLYDADSAISRSVAIGALTVTMVAIFAGSEQLIGALGEQYFGQDLGIMASGLGAAVAAAMIAPLHHRMHAWAERRFRTGLARLRDDFPLLLADLRETMSVRGIAETVLDVVLPVVRATRGVVVVGGAVEATREVLGEALDRWRADWSWESESGLAIDGGDSLLPVRVLLEAPGHGAMGWLLLGPRPDGSLFGKDECEALTRLADPLARALDIARQRDEREAGYERRIAALEAAIRPGSEHVGRTA